MERMNKDVFLMDVKSYEIDNLGDISLPGIYNAPVSKCGEVCCIFEWKTLTVTLYDFRTNHWKNINIT